MLPLILLLYNHGCHIKVCSQPSKRKSTQLHTVIMVTVEFNSTLILINLVILHLLLFQPVSFHDNYAVSIQFHLPSKTHTGTQVLSTSQYHRLNKQNRLLHKSKQTRHQMVCYTALTGTLHRLNKPLQRIQKNLINVLVIFVDVYYFNKRHTKCEKAVEQLE